MLFAPILCPPTNRFSRSNRACMIGRVLAIGPCNMRSMCGVCETNRVGSSMLRSTSVLRSPRSLRSLRAGVFVVQPLRCMRTIGPCGAGRRAPRPSRMPSSKTLGARSLAGNGSRPQVSPGRTPARSGAGLPASREDIAARMCCAAQGLQANGYCATILPCPQPRDALGPRGLSGHTFPTESA